MRRKKGALLEIELGILNAAVAMATRGVETFHGFQLAKEIKEQDAARLLTAHGTLYRALGRMEDAGLLTSEWEDADQAVEEGRPRRRLYRLTADGVRAMATAEIPTRANAAWGALKA